MLHATDTARVVAQDERTTVRVDGRPVFRVGATEGADASTRAEQIERRVATLLENPEAIAPVLIEPSGLNGENRVLSVAGVPVVTVTPTDAEDNLTNIDALAVQWAQSLDRELTRAQERRLEWGGRFVAEVRASVEAAFPRLYESVLRIVPRAVAASLVLGLFWIVAISVRRVLRLLFHRVIDDLTIENLITQLGFYAVWGLGLLVAVDAFGFDPETVIAGLGITGLALGFALKDIISNFVSGLLILALRPFEIADQIVVGDTEGGVERIELRATHVRTYDGRLVLVPNAEVFTSRITNNTASPVRRASATFPLGYDADLILARSTVLESVVTVDGVSPEPRPSMRIQDLGADHIAVEVRFWTDSRRSDYVATASLVRSAIVDALRAAGVSLPDPGVLTIVRASAPTLNQRQQVLNTVDPVNDP
ncbi:MAG: mechanosensitive ion channel family protein [Chloroflexota bacterium]|nr:mechanosensitive ion channel family protein [Chloroflexota bacterium]